MSNEVAIAERAKALTKRIKELLEEHGLGDEFNPPDTIDVGIDKEGDVVIDGTGDGAIYIIAVTPD